MSEAYVMIRVPERMKPYLLEYDEKQTFARNAMIMYPFIQNLTISYGRAAEIMGVHKLDLIDYYDSIGLPYLNQSVEDLKQEMADYRALKEKIPKWSVKKVEPLPNYILLLTYESGEERVFDATPLLQKPKYIQLKEPAFFKRAKVAYGTVIWPDDIDIAPEYLYEKSIPAKPVKIVYT